MRKAAQYSAVMHIVIVLLAVFGLPAIFDMTREIQPSAISVEILPVSELSNVPNRVKTQDQKKEPPKSEPEKPVEQPTPEPPKPEAKPTPPTKTEEAKAEPVPNPDKKDDKKKPDKKDDKKDKKDPKKEQEDLDAILKSVKTAANQSQQMTPQADKGSDTTSKSDRFDPTAPLSMSEKDAIRSQFVKCWIVPAGAKDAYNLIVTLNVELDKTGTVQKVDIASGDKNRYGSDSFFRAAVDSAARAVWKCSPLKNLDAGKYSSWREMELTFDPREMLF